PESVEKIGEGAFEDNKIKEVEINYDLEFDKNAFGENSEIKIKEIKFERELEDKSFFEEMSKNKQNQIFKDEFYKENADKLNWKEVAENHNLTRKNYLDNKEHLAEYKEEIFLNDKI